VAVWDSEEMLWATATILAWASLAGFGIAWDAHVKFRSLLDAQLPDEWDMSPVWERRSHRWRGIGLAALGISILLFIARIVGRTVL
jgi:hypothetical protein